MNRAQRRHKAQQNKTRSNGTPYVTERVVNGHRPSKGTHQPRARVDGLRRAVDYDRRRTSRRGGR